MKLLPGLFDAQRSLFVVGSVLAVLAVTGCSETSPNVATPDGGRTTSAPAVAALPAATDFSTSTSTPTTSLAPESVPETTDPTEGPPLTPEAVRRSLVDAAASEGFGTATSKFSPLCGFGWDSCTITEIRTRDDSVVLTVQIGENPDPEAFPDEFLAEFTGRSAFGILGDQFPQLDYIQVTNPAGLVLADVRCYYAVPVLVRCP